MPEQNFRVKNGINVGTAVTITTTEYQVGNTRIHSSGVEARSIIVTDNAGISTVPQLKLTGRLYDANNNVGTGTSVLVSTGIGVSWIAIATAALQGVQGVQGTFGTQGTQGILGTQGTTGIQGTTGVQGTTGTQGTLGTQGIQGITGAQGFNGTLGTQGATGSQGTTGTQGTLGTQGVQGTTGTQGTLGTQGATGPTGGSSGQVLYNSGGTATSSSNLTFDGTTFKYNNGYGSAATVYGCRAWVNFNGNSSGIRASGNVSSITRHSTGNYSVNFSTALSDANFAAVGSAAENSSDSQRYVGFFDSFATTSCRLETRYPNNGQLEDVAIVSVVVLR